MICTLTTSLKLSWKAQLPVARASSTSYSATCSPWFMFSLNFIFCDVCSASVFWFFLQDILGLWSPSSFSSTHCWNADNSPRAWLSSFSPFHLNDILSHCCILASALSHVSMIFRSLFRAPHFYIQLLLAMYFWFTHQGLNREVPTKAPHLFYLTLSLL